MDKKYGFLVYDQPIEECFSYAHANGMKHLEIDLKKKHSHVRTFSTKRIQNIAALCNEYGIELSLHPPYNINLAAHFPMRHVNIARLKQSIRLAHHLNATHITTHIGDFNRPVSWAHPREHALDRAIKSLRSLLKSCEKWGVFLAVENVIPLPEEAGFTFIGDNVADFQYIFSRLDSKYLKFCLDIGHANTNEGPIEYVDKLGDRIINIHFHDNNGKYDQHLDVGDGTVPWTELLAALENINYPGPYVSECFKSQPHKAVQRLEAKRQ
ncbi:MAG: sugar phosphate isomerase/epimerase [bacterium]|nr:sugar phosphate isomerase/epimerase [bacterium]